MQKIPNNTHRSKEIQKILNQKPHWIIRNGIGALLIFGLIFLFVVSYVRKPKIIECNVLIAKRYSSFIVNSTNAGFISKLNVKNQEFVRKGDTIIEIKNIFQFFNEHLNTNSTVVKKGKEYSQIIAPTSGEVLYKTKLYINLFLWPEADVFEIVTPELQLFGTTDISSIDQNEVSLNQIVTITIEDNIHGNNFEILGAIDEIRVQRRSEKVIAEIRIIPESINEREKILFESSHIVGKLILITHNEKLLDRIIKPITEVIKTRKSIN